ncbi:hypothetical protein D3C75_867360 [compost metagenome]
MERGENPVGPVLFDTHLLHVVFAPGFGDDPGGAGAVVGIAANLVGPCPVLPRFGDILVLAHGGMIAVIREFPDGKAGKIVGEQHNILHISSPSSQEN